MRGPGTGGAVGLLLLSLLDSSSSSSAAAQARNILLIVVDDLRPQMKTYGVPWMHTPNFDKLAEQGVIFENAYVQQSICSPTRNSFLYTRRASRN